MASGNGFYSAIEFSFEGNGFYSAIEFSFESKWFIDPKFIFVGPKIGEGAHAKSVRGKNVAIKIVHRGEAPERNYQEGSQIWKRSRMLSRVQHKNLVKFIGASKEPIMVIVTELLLGGTLRKYLLNLRPRCLDRRVAIGFALGISAVPIRHRGGGDARQAGFELWRARRGSVCGFKLEVHLLRGDRWQEMEIHF